MTLLTRLLERDDYYASMARHYFTSGTALGGRGSKKQEEGELVATRSRPLEADKHMTEFENLALPMTLRLREQAMRRIEDER